MPMGDHFCAGCCRKKMQKNRGTQRGINEKSRGGEKKKKRQK